MTVLENYDPARFDSLPPLDEAEAGFTRHMESLDSLARLVSARDAGDRIGFALLHRHFGLNADERLVERLDHVGCESVSSPRRGPFGLETVPHLFRATRCEDGYRWYPLEFVDASESRASFDESLTWLDQQADLLDELARSLDRDGAIDVFGISLSHGREEIPCDSDEVLVEDTDCARRVLTMRPRKLDDLQGTSTPTNWSADDGKVVMRCTCQRAGDDRHGHFETN